MGFCSSKLRHHLHLQHLEVTLAFSMICWNPLKKISSTSTSGIHQEIPWDTSWRNHSYCYGSVLRNLRQGDTPESQSMSSRQLPRNESGDPKESFGLSSIGMMTFPTGWKKWSKSPTRNYWDDDIPHWVGKIWKHDPNHQLNGTMLAVLFRRTSPGTRYSLGLSKKGPGWKAYLAALRKQSHTALLGDVLYLKTSCFEMFRMILWLVVYLPLCKILVNWDDELPNIWKKSKTCSKPPTSSHVFSILFGCLTFIFFQETINLARGMSHFQIPSWQLDRLILKKITEFEDETWWNLIVPEEFEATKDLLFMVSFASTSGQHIVFRLFCLAEALQWWMQQTHLVGFFGNIGLGAKEKKSWHAFHWIHMNKQSMDAYCMIFLGIFQPTNTHSLT